MADLCLGTLPLALWILKIGCLQDWWSSEFKSYSTTCFKLLCVRALSSFLTVHADTEICGSLNCHSLVFEILKTPLMHRAHGFTVWVLPLWVCVSAWSWKIVGHCSDATCQSQPNLTQSISYNDSRMLRLAVCSLFQTCTVYMPL